MIPRLIIAFARAAGWLQDWLMRLAGIPTDNHTPPIDNQGRGHDR